MCRLRTLVALLLTFAAAGGQDNLLSNGDFERGATGWLLDDAVEQHGSFAVERDERRGNVASLENRGPDQTVAAYQVVPVTPGKVYVVTGWWRSTKLQEGAGLAIHALGPDGRLLKRAWVHHIPTWGFTGWRRMYGEYRPPEGAATLQVRISIYRRGQVWVDDLELVATDPPPKEQPWGEKLDSFGLTVERIETPRPVYTLAVGDLDGDRVNELLSGDIDGLLRAFEPDGRALWEVDLGGLPLAIAAGDLNGDGRDEVAVCTADASGRLRVFDADGQPLWSHVDPNAIYGQVLVADADGDSRSEVYATHANELVALSGEGEVRWRRDFGGPRMRSLAVGDVTGDGRPEIVASLEAQSLYAAAFGPDGDVQWRFEPVKVKGLAGEDVIAADLDGDGVDEVVMASSQGRVACLKDGDLEWLASRERSLLWPRHRDAMGNLGSGRAEIVVGDYAPDRDGLETLVALVDSVWLLDRHGKFIWDGPSGLLLRDLVDGGDGSLYVPSGDLRDRAVYRLRATLGNGNPLAEYQPADPIQEALAGIYERLPAGRAPATDAGRFHVIYANLIWPFRRYGSLQRLRETSRALGELSSERLEFLFMLWPKDLPVELHRGAMIEPSEIRKVAAFLEEIGQPFLFFIDHGCSPNLSLESVEATLQLAPNTCRGFYVAENTALYPSEKWDTFVEYAMKVMDLCRRYGGKKFVMKEMYDTWCAIPPDPKVQATLLQPQYRDTLVALYATNNPYAPELQIGGMIGLKQAGLVGDWGISTQHWNWSWSAHALGERYANFCPADVILRMELATACLGGRWFHIEGGQEYLDRGDATLKPRAKLHRDLVYKLIRTGLLAPVEDRDNLSFSPLVIQRTHHPAVDEARADGRKLGSPAARRGGPLYEGFLGVRDALQTTLPDYLPSYAYNARRYTTSMFPPTPYGTLRFVPESSAAVGVPAGTQVLRTDGRDVWLEGGKQSAAAARPAVLEALRRGADTLPFSADGAAVYTHRIAGGYRVWLLDPGYLNPVGVKTVLRVGDIGAKWTATDAVTSETLPITDGGVPITVPAGAFRVIDVKVQ